MIQEAKNEKKGKLNKRARHTLAKMAKTWDKYDSTASRMLVLYKTNLGSITSTPSGHPNTTMIVVYKTRYFLWAKSQE